MGATAPTFTARLPEESRSLHDKSSSSSSRKLVRDVSEFRGESVFTDPTRRVLLRREEADLAMSPSRMTGSPRGGVSEVKFGDTDDSSWDLVASP